MINFNEHALEMSVIKLFKDEGYIHLNDEIKYTEKEQRYYYKRIWRSINIAAMQRMASHWARRMVSSLCCVIFPVLCMKQTRFSIICFAMALSLTVRTERRRTSILNLLILTLLETIFSRQLISSKLRVSTIICVFLMALCSSTTSCCCPWVQEHSQREYHHHGYVKALDRSLSQRFPRDFQI